MKYVGLSGRAGSGKDMVADYLMRNAQRLFPGKVVRRAAFADPLKEWIVAVSGLSRYVVWGSQAEKAEPRPELNGKSVREAHYTLGRALAELNPNWMTRRLFSVLQPLYGDVGIITDVRGFGDEVDQVRARGGKIIRLMRGEGNEGDVYLDSWEPDAYVDNREMTVTDCQLHVVAHLMNWGIIDAKL